MTRPRVGIVASVNGLVGIPAARAVLEAGGSALDAVEAATRVVESNPEDHSVGYGGYPNLLGEVELDASIMDGATRNAGAVGAIRGFRHAVTVARAVLDRMPHVLVVGHGAEMLAREIGMEPEDLLSDHARDVWQRGIDGREVHEESAKTMLSHLVALTTDPEKIAGTVNFIACDRHGHIASAVSTSGWAWKHPGRLGDSPLIGSGNYADDRYGAATCTGWGEISIRSVAAYSVVHAMKLGASLEKACTAAFDDLPGMAELAVPGRINIVAMDAAGGHFAVSNHPGSEYASWHLGMADPAVLPRLLVETPTEGRN